MQGIVIVRVGKDGGLPHGGSVLFRVGAQLEVDNQYVLPDEIDIDIFASKKRTMKVN